MGAAREFASLKREIDRVEERLKALKRRRMELEELLIPWFEQEGVQNVNIDGVTVYLHRMLWARPKEGDRDAAVAALRAYDPAYITIGFNTNAVSALFRELEESDDGVPAALAAGFDLTPTFSIRAQEAPGKGERRRRRRDGEE
jgi:hypothetical protein